MSDIENELLSVVNASGFLFQLRVANLIESTSSRHGWRILVQEHPWSDSSMGADGFIDIVAEKNSMRLVLECKRAVGGQWVFLVPGDKSRDSQTARFLVTLNRKDGSKAAEWIDFTLEPFSPEAAFCVVRGSGEKDRPLLERLASSVVQSTDSFAAQELAVENNLTLDLNTFYIPAIVTTSNLAVCTVSPEKIDLKDGKIPKGVAKFQNEPLVRFRKALVPSPRIKPQHREMRQVNMDAERTVLVINASAIPEVLRKLKLLKLHSLR